MEEDSVLELLAVLMEGGDWPELIFERPAWYRDAACRGMPSHRFFPNLGELIEVRTTCASCPVREPCLELALETDERGFWGGTSERDRARLRRQRRAS